MIRTTVLLCTFTALLLGVTGCDSQRKPVTAIVNPPVADVDLIKRPFPYEVQAGATLKLTSNGNGPKGQAKFEVFVNTSVFTNVQNASGTIDAGGTSMALIGKGSAYLVGVRPYGGTDGGSGIQPGSGFIVAKDYKRADGSVADRFILILASTSGKLEISDKTNPLPLELETPFTYVDIVNGKFDGAVQMASPQGAPLQQFIDEVLTRAQQAQLPVPLTW